MVEPEPQPNPSVDEAEEALLDALSEGEIDGGHGVPHRTVREWLLKLGNGIVAPPPLV